ncbi:glycerol-3-phosphate dehydrogenase/oxidase [Marinobacterium mangrovicola]|uniref:Alpha-glycerophosphate oxidase/glycerol-3-phosphate dehydrogenase n=1 Tax=Marinobacterium mangrovicola TaxID=1476959 RepID=A0A4R1G4H3_9GAMM|nr:glycerol-3-phosphate dehydrogenase/oxidase [Marinobacterium mangrovicola]TCK02564.1 alpha-glycerophosphate oxidase/glycerol-3-phosphate dehydrogenase [Marinobacterium mangrovicola]
MSLRSRNIARLQSGQFDVLILGGGINGAVSAAALAARGARVALIDRGDFAGETSSNSSNLAWGGIKYLESGEYLLVNKLCRSRNQLMRAYPSTVREMRFLASVESGFRKPPWMLYAGTLLYWLLGRGKTRLPEIMGPSRLKAREPVINTANTQAGVEYSDCYLHDNDARFTFNFIRSAMDCDASAANYVECQELSRSDDLWHANAQDLESGKTLQIKARAVINACGPWTDQINQRSGQPTRHRHLFSKGIHLIVERITDSNRILTFFASDGRLFFVIPMGPKTCIGTTDTQVENPRAEVSDEDRQFVLDNANSLLNLPHPLSREDIIAERCGVRPLAVSNGDGKQADWVKLSRKHAIDVDEQNRHLSIFGGKLTDCINVGEEICDIISGLDIELPYPKQIWYGEPHKSVYAEYLHQARLMNLDGMTPGSSSEKLTSRLWRRYAASALELLEGIRENPSWGELLIDNAEYLRGEVEMAARREMVTRLDDFLRRRSKIAQVVPKDALADAPGLREACVILFGDRAEEKLAEYLKAHAAEPVPAESTEN